MLLQQTSRGEVVVLPGLGGSLRLFFVFAGLDMSEGMEELLQIRATTLLLDRKQLLPCEGKK